MEAKPCVTSRSVFLKETVLLNFVLVLQRNLLVPPLTKEMSRGKHLKFTSFFSWNIFNVNTVM